MGPFRRHKTERLVLALLKSRMLHCRAKWELKEEINSPCVSICKDFTDLDVHAQRVALQLVLNLQIPIEHCHTSECMRYM